MTDNTSPLFPPAAYNFDHPLDRRNTSSDKWDKYADRDILPMWVADTDFVSPPAVLQALHQRIEHGNFGYGRTPDALITTVIERMQRLYHWKIEPQWLVWLPGMVCGLHLACRSVCTEGDSVLTPKPIYPPFMSAPRLSQRDLITTPMVQQADGRWVWDLNALEQAITPTTRLLLLCNPHNPGGTVYRREELQQLAALCARHEIVICSDEIHCDLILEPGVAHIPTASLSPEIAQRTITLMAPSKTFNIAGLGCSLAIIPDPELRKRYIRTRRGIVPDVNLLGYTAALAAYRDSDSWNQRQLEYLRSNRDRLIEAINQIPGLKLAPFEATYLAWIDVSGLGLSDPPAFFEAAGVGLSPGADFGDARFMRLNFGCTRQLLEEAIRRIQVAVDALFQQ